MFTVTKEFKIPIAHRLSKHLRQCSNIHGHTIKVEVEVERERLNDNDMVLDFYDLKEIVNDIFEQWDHSLLLNEYDSVIKNFKSLKHQKLYSFNGDPTSENMCVTLFNILYDKFNNVDSFIRLKSITVWESDSSKAKYEYKEQE